MLNKGRGCMKHGNIVVIILYIIIMCHKFHVTVVMIINIL